MSDAPNETEKIPDAQLDIADDSDCAAADTSVECWADQTPPVSKKPTEQTECLDCPTLPELLEPNAKPGTTHCVVPAESARAHNVSRIQAGLRPDMVSDVKTDGKIDVQLTVTDAADVRDKRLTRVLTSRNADGSKSTITSIEKYAVVVGKDGKVEKNEDGTDKVEKNEDGTDKTLVLSQTREAIDKNNKLTFRAETKNEYTEQGDLKDSVTDVFRGDSEGKPSKYNSFVTNNTYLDGNLVRQESRVLDAGKEPKPVQSTISVFGYDTNNNRISENITRVAGNNQTTVENRKHDFNEKSELTGTTSDLIEIDKVTKEAKNVGRVTSTFTHKADGTREEHTTQFDKFDGKDRPVHEFHAEFDKEGNRTHSKDVHTEFYANGKKRAETVSEFNRNGDSSAIKQEFDSTTGAETKKSGIIQKADGSVVSAMPDAAGNHALLVPADKALLLGGPEDDYSENPVLDQKEVAWIQLERLSGDATNRDVLKGWSNLGDFAGGEGQQTAAIAKLTKWGLGDAVNGVDILEKHWGNGDGRAAQGVRTYLSLGAGVSAKEATKKTEAGFNDIAKAATNFMAGDRIAGAEAFARSLQNFQGAIKLFGQDHQHAEKMRIKISDKPDVAGATITHMGNGDCPNGICVVRKIGDTGHSPEAGEQDAIELGIDGIKKWSPTGDALEAARNLTDLTAGDLNKLPEITATMGTSEALVDGEVVVTVDNVAGNNIAIALGKKLDGTIDPSLAVDTFKLAGVTPEGYQPLVAANNFFEGGVTTAMVEVDGKLQPALDANGKPIYLRSAETTLEALTIAGEGVPFAGVKVVGELSTKKDAAGNVLEVDMRVGFTQVLPSLGEKFEVVNGEIVAVRDSKTSANAVLAYGAPAIDKAGNEIPVLDDKGHPVSKGIVGAQTFVELTRTSSGTNPALLPETLKTANANEFSMFKEQVEKGLVPDGQSFIPANKTLEALVVIGRTEDQTVGSAFSGAQLLTKPISLTGLDGETRTFTLSRTGSAIDGLQAIREAAPGSADKKTVLDGAKQIVGFSDNQTFTTGARNTAAMADRTDRTTGELTAPSQLFSQGIANVSAYGKDNDFSQGRVTVAFIGGGKVADGVQQIRTAADATTDGSVRQMAAVTRAAGGDDPMVGAAALKSYRAADGNVATTYAQGATALYSNLYGSRPAAGQTLQVADVDRAVRLATPGTSPSLRLQAGMDKTNALSAEAAKSNPEVTGAQVLRNLEANREAFNAVQKAPDAATAVTALRALPPAQLAAIFTSATPATAAQLNKETVAPVVAKQTVVAPSVEKSTVAPQADRNVLSAVQTERTVAAAAQADRTVAAAAQVEHTASAAAQTERTVAATSQAERAAAIAIKAERTEEAEKIEARVAAIKADHTEEVEQIQRNRAAAAASDSSRVAETAVSTAAARQAAVQAALAKSDSVFTVAKAFQELINAAPPTRAAGAAPGAAPGAITTQTEAGLKGGFRNQAVDSVFNPARQNSSVGVSITGLPVANSLKVGDASPSKFAAHGNYTFSAARQVIQSAAEATRNGRQLDNSPSAKPGTAPFRVVSSSESVVIGKSQVGRSVTTNGAGNNTHNTHNTSMITRSSDGSIVSINRALYGGETLKGVASLDSTRKFRFNNTNGKSHALLGAEIALVALLVSASVSKERAAKKKAELANLTVNAELAKLSDIGADVTELTDSAVGPKYKALTRPTWLVRHNEDLVKLAEHLFHEAELGWLIADLNIGQSKESYLDGKRVVELRARQRIDLPVWQDIVEFHKNRASNAKPENLVTIVTEASVDTELMNATLGLAMGATVAPARPAVALNPVAVPVAAFAIAGDTPAAKESRGKLIFSHAKKAALAMRKVARAVSVDHQDQGPTGGATVTEELQPVHV